MNKTYAYLGIVGIVVLGLAGTVVLMVFSIDAGPFIGLFSTTLPIAITAALTIDGLSKIQAKTEAVQEVAVKTAKNVNGNMSAMIDLASRNPLSYEDQETIARAENDRRDLEQLIGGGKHVAE